MSAEAIKQRVELIEDLVERAFPDMPVTVLTALVSNRNQKDIVEVDDRFVPEDPRELIGKTMVRNEVPFGLGTALTIESIG